MSLGVQHPSKPVTASDKKMSERHHEHRDEIADLKAKGADKEKILKKSVKYNEAHQKEHEKAQKDAKKELAKVRKHRGTSDGHMVS